MPVLSGLRVTADAGIARAGRHRPRAHDPGAHPGRQRRRGQRGRPGPAVLGDRAPARGRHRVGGAGRRRRPDRGGPVRHDAAHAVGGGVPAPARGEPRPACGSTPRPSPRRCARWCPARPATTPARSSPVCCSPPRPAGCASWPPTRTGSRCATSQGVSMLEEGQKVLVAPRAWARCSGCSRARRARSRSCSASARSCSASARTEVTTRLIEGEFPNYQQLIPSGYPNRLTVSRDALQAAVNRVRLVGRAGHRADPARR